MSSHDQRRPVVVVEDDHFLRMFRVILDPDAPAEMVDAVCDFMAHDEPDFQGWMDRLRSSLVGLWPARVVMVHSTEELARRLPEADIVVVEGEEIGAPQLAAAPHLKAVQKYGSLTRGIDVDACQARGIDVLTIRRRANIQCAEHIFALMLALSRKIHLYANRLTPEQLAERGHELRPFDRRFTPNGNWARVPGLRALNGSTIGIIGLGEIGREVASRANAFGMRVIYHQRTRLSPEVERAFAAAYASLNDLLAASDWIVPQIPGTPATRGFLDGPRLARIKPGAMIVNVSRADLIDREALIAALASGQLGGIGMDPPYWSPGRADDELMRFDNVVITPHFGGSPRRNALEDFEDMMSGIAAVLQRKETV